MNANQCVFSIDPDDNRDEIVVMMTCEALKQKIAFIKFGDEDWTYVKELQDLSDIAFFNGVFFVVDRRGVNFSLHVIKNNDNPCKLRLISSPVVDDDQFEQYLVEYPEGDLLRVVKNKTGSLFMIYKLIWFSRNPI